MLVQLTPVHLGLTVRNLFGGNEALEQKPEWAFGASFSYQNSFILSAATFGDMKKLKPYQYGFGAEYVSGYYFSLKGGFRTQPDKHLSWWSAGLSFLAPKISFHYSMDVSTEPSGKPEHVIGTTVLL
jgi:hypothetical protein